jgi:hypothetical protein
MTAPADLARPALRLSWPRAACAALALLGLASCDLVPVAREAQVVSLSYALIEGPGAATAAEAAMVEPDLFASALGAEPCTWIADFGRAGRPNARLAGDFGQFGTVFSLSAAGPGARSVPEACPTVDGLGLSVGSPSQVLSVGVPTLAGTLDVQLTRPGETTRVTFGRPSDFSATITEFDTDANRITGRFRAALRDGTGAFLLVDGSFLLDE